VDNSGGIFEDKQQKHAGTEEYVTTLDEPVGLLNHKSQKQTYRSPRQISTKMGLI